MSEPMSEPSEPMSEPWLEQLQEPISGRQPGLGPGNLGERPVRTERFLVVSGNRTRPELPWEFVNDGVELLHDRARILGSWRRAAVTEDAQHQSSTDHQRCVNVHE